MRGADSYSESLFSTIRLEDFVPANHPLRPIRTWMNDTLAKMDEKFSAMYEADIRGGRPSIAPEKLIRAMLLQVLFSIRESGKASLVASKQNLWMRNRNPKQRLRCPCGLPPSLLPVLKGSGRNTQQAGKVLLGQADL